VITNQAPDGEVTKTTGVKHGDGRSMVASISELPAALAGTVGVDTFAVVAAPAVVVRQLTIALNWLIGFVPCRFGGTGARDHHAG